MKSLLLIFSTLSIFTLSNSALLASADLYKSKCQACHQANGEGLHPAFPPLAKSEWVNGPIDNLINIQHRGLIGKIKVKDKEYNSVMAVIPGMTDEEIASVLTYVRSNFGNKSSAVTAERVKALRPKTAKPMLKVKELIDPNSEEGKKITKKENPSEEDKKAKEGKKEGADSKGENKDNAPAAKPGKEINKTSLDSDRKLPTFVYGWVALCIAPLLMPSIFRK